MPDVGEEVVPVESLTDLVDVAIDADCRVVHDPDRGIYAIIDGDTVYRYAEGFEKTRFEAGSAGTESSGEESGARADD